MTRARVRVDVCLRLCLSRGRVGEQYAVQVDLWPDTIPKRLYQCSWGGGLIWVWVWVWVWSDDNNVGGGALGRKVAGGGLGLR